MSVARSVFSRAREALFILLSGDDDLHTLCGGEGTAASPTHPSRIYDGPKTDEEPLVITPRQINVIFGGGVLEYGPGISGVANLSIPLRVLYFDYFNKNNYPAAPTNERHDVAAHIIALGQAGSDDEGNGRLYDPDAAPGATGVAKFVTTSLLRAEVSPRGVKGDTAAATVIDFTYGTRVGPTLVRR